MRLLTVADIMKELRAILVVRVARNTGFMVGAASMLENENRALLSVPVADDWLGFGNDFREMGHHCVELGLKASAATCRRMEALTERGQESQVTIGELRHVYGEFEGRFADEMEGTVTLFVEPADVGYYTDPTGAFQKDAAVTERFPSIRYDVEEAGKCLALSRSTACVFHLMRVMEAALRVLARTLNDPRLNPDVNRSWDAILKKCREELDKPLAQRSPEWREDEKFYSGAAARLTAVKDAWRNPTMHVGTKYTPEETQDIWNHVGAFMRHLATKLKE